MSDVSPTAPAANRASSPTATWRRRLAPLLAVPTPVVFVAAAALAALVLWRQGSIGEIAGSLARISAGDAAALVLAYALGIFGLGIRWHTLVRMVGGTPGWAVSVEAFLTSVMVNYAAPIGLAVPTRAALAIRDLRLSPAQSGAVVAWEASLDIAALGMISLVWLATGRTRAMMSFGWEAPVLLPALLLASVGVVAVYVWRRTAIGERAGGFVTRGLGFARERPVAALLAAALTAGYWLVQLFLMAILLRVLGSPAPLSLLLGLMGLPVLIGMLSPVPGGAGVREGLMAAAAGVAGYATAPVLLAAIAYRLALFVVTPLVWGAVRLTSVMRPR